MDCQMLYRGIFLVAIALIQDLPPATSASCPTPSPCHCDISIHCERQSLTSVPSSLLSSPPSSNDAIFYTLNLKDNAITNVGKDDFQNYPVHGIDLSNNPISHIDDNAFLSLAGLLLELNLEHCGLHSIPQSVSNLTSLKKLNIRDNPIAVLRPSMTSGFGKSLLSLSMGNTKILYWPSALKSLIRLETLEMSNNKVSFLRSDAVSAFANTLRDLRLVNTSLATFQVALRDLKVLQYLDLSHNPIQEISKGSFANFADTLKHLTLTNGDLSYLPAALEDLSSLVELDLSHNPMMSTNDDVVGGGPSPLLVKVASTLTSLRLESTHLLAVPMAVKDLKVLKTLNLRGNAIQRLENYQFMNLVKLSDLDLSNNPLSSIPYQSFSGLTSLIILNLANCSMSYVPTGALSHLKSLLTFDQSNNRIHVMLDHAIPVNQRLSSVDLSGNLLTNVSMHAFDGVYSMRTLNLNRCHLKALPKALQDAQGLRMVELSSNNIPCTCDSFGWVRQWQAATGILPHLSGTCDNNPAWTFDHFIRNEVPLCPGNSGTVG